MKKIIIIGAGGHAKVVIDIILKRNIYLNEKNIILGILDDSEKIQNTRILEIPIIGKICEISKMDEDVEYIIAIGSNKIREKIKKENEFIKYYTAIHPRAIIGTNVNIGAGTVIMGNSVINPDSKIGRHCIINTGAIVEHDNIIEDYVHISPNVTLAGNIKIEEKTWIGAGAVVIQGVAIAKKVIVGAGAVVIKNLDKNGVYVGNPAKKIKEIKIEE